MNARLVCTLFLILLDVYSHQLLQAAHRCDQLTDHLDAVLPFLRTGKQPLLL